MNQISVCLIVKDEQEVLPRCLDCVKKFADELIVVDTGSTDDTREIAKRYTDKVYDFKWIDDFAAARNFSFSKATRDYIMWLDADDVIFDDDILKIWDFKLSRPSDTDVYMLKYVTAFSKDLKPEFSFYRERLVRRDKNFQWQDPVHEVIVPRGKIEYMNVQIYHCKEKPSAKGRNLRIYQKFIEKGNKLSPRQQFYYARELYFNGQINAAINEFEAFLASKNGWIENNIEACLNLARCYQMEKDYDKALGSLFRTFQMALPRGEVLCEIGAIYITLERYDEAIYWFKLARVLHPNIKKGGFVITDCYDFTPALQLCVCYYRKGQKKRAKHYHNIAKKLKPTDKCVVYNEKFFS